MTRLEAFMKANKISPAALAREANISRQQLFRIRKGRTKDMSMLTALRIRDACGRLLFRFVRISEVFEVD